MLLTLLWTETLSTIIELLHSSLFWILVVVVVATWLVIRAASNGHFE